MTAFRVRGSAQWAAALSDPSAVEELELIGPAWLSLEGIERMVNLRHVWFSVGSPTDQLHRLRELSAFEWVVVQLGAAPHDVGSLLDCRIPALEIFAFDARRGLEVAEVAYGRITGLASLRLIVHAAAMIPWDCSWLPGTSTLRKLWVQGLYLWPASAEGALRSAVQLKELDCHPGLAGDKWPELQAQPDEEFFRSWQTEMEKALPGASIRALSWRASLPELDRPWELNPVAAREAYQATIPAGELADLVSGVHDADGLRALLERWNPAMALRVSVTSAGDEVRVEAPARHDLRFIQELLTLGAPTDPTPVDAPSPRALADGLDALVAGFLAEVRQGQLVDDDAAARRWAQAIGSLDATDAEALEDTVVREQLFEALRQPLAEAGLDAEYVVLAT